MRILFSLKFPATIFLEFLSHGPFSRIAKINLETDYPDLAYRLFGMSASSSTPPSYLGLAMAQFELGKPWIDNFRRGEDPIDFNEDAIKRYEKMGGGYPGGAERNRR